ncbi:unnamed protein product [Rhodiola kirilowii]
MKVFVKTLKGTNFPIEVNPEDKIVDVKKKIEEAQGADVYPAAQQMLIHQGKVLKDETTLEENKVLNDNFIVVMLSKTKSAGEGSTTSSAATAKAPERSTPPPAAAVPQPSPVSTVVSTPPPAAAEPTPVVAAG